MTDINKILKNTADELTLFANIEVQFTGKRVSVRPVVRTKKNDKEKIDIPLPGFKFNV